MYDSEDRRVQRTRRRLHEALAELVHRRCYERIGVKEILAQAHVARSTFYAHFQGKEELLLQAFDDIVRGAWEHDVLGFSMPLLRHVERQRLAGTPAGPQAALHRQLQALLELRIAERLQRGARPASPIGLTQELLARHAAATFVTVLEWWSIRKDLSAEQADAAYRRLVQPAFGR